jgi:DNA-binding Lrp family transcriptional regulator
MLPALKLYKIGVSLDLSGAADLTPRASPPKFTEDHRHKAMEFAVTDADKRMIRVLQRDLPVTERPFDRWAREADIALDDLLRAAKAYLEEKRMRRFSAVLYHREVGVTANAMGVWAVPPHQQDEFGAIAAGFQAVTHCYLRPTYDDWPYSIFTMVHGTQEKECSALFSAISQATGVRQYLAVYSSREFKKTRLQYFVGDIEAWEAAALSAAH